MNRMQLGALLGVTIWGAGTAAVYAQAPQPLPTTTDPAPTLNSPSEKEAWKGPFGGAFSATFTFATDYAFRGISQTARQVTVQPSFGYETPSIGQDLAVSAYVAASGSNFVSAGSSAEIDLLAGFRGKALDGKLTFDLGFARYTYLSAPADLDYDFNEFGLVVGYDFQSVLVKAAVYYSNDFFANSGEAWYKWAQVSMPLRFIHINENIAFRLFGSLGNQYVERYTSYDISRDNYWDWQTGLAATVYSFDLAVAYVDTNLDVDSCANTRNCAPRIMFTLSKSF